MLVCIFTTVDVMNLYSRPFLILLYNIYIYILLYNLHYVLIYMCVFVCWCIIDGQILYIDQLWCLILYTIKTHSLLPILYTCYHGQHCTHQGKSIRLSSTAKRAGQKLLHHSTSVLWPQTQPWASAYMQNKSNLHKMVQIKSILIVAGDCGLLI